MARLYAEFTAAGKDWFFNVWQPDFVKDAESGKKVPLYEASEEQLASDPGCWLLNPDEEWHGFGNVEQGYCMLDPIKVSIVTPGVKSDAELEDWGIPAAVVSSYLDNKGIVVEKRPILQFFFCFLLA